MSDKRVPTTIKMTEQERKEMDEVAERLGLSNRSEAIRFVMREKLRELAVQSPSAA